MVRIEESVIIHAPIDTVFDAERDLSLHLATQQARGERVVGGVASGLIGFGEEVEWEAVHLGVRQWLRVRITAMERPRFFRDEMVSGAFKSFSHDHYFRPRSSGETEKRDVLVFEAPLGWLGRLAEATFLAAHMRRFLRTKNAELKYHVESRRGVVRPGQARPARPGQVPPT